jgi:hypothetical protein
VLAKTKRWITKEAAGLNGHAAEEELESPDLVERLRGQGFSFERLTEFQNQMVDLGYETRGGGYHRVRYYPILRDGVGVVLPSVFRGVVHEVDVRLRTAVLQAEEGLRITLVGWRPRVEGRHYWPASDPPGGEDYLEIRLVTPKSMELILRVPLNRVYCVPAVGPEGEGPPE